MGQRLLKLLLALALPSTVLAEIRLGSEFQVNTTTNFNQINASAATNAAGDFVVAWHSYHDGSNTGVFAQRFSSAGASLGVEFQLNTYTTGFQFAPSVAVETNGDFIVAWTSRNQYGDSDDIFAGRFSSAGTLLATEFRVNSYTANKQQYPRAVSDADGDFVVVWESSGAQDGANYGVFGQRFSSEGALLGAEFQVNTVTASDQRAVTAAAESDGDFVVAWHSRGQDGQSYGIFAQRFSSSGAAQSGEFQVNTYTESYQSRPSVAVGADGAFVIAWESYGQDGSQDGTFARLFGSAGDPLATELQVNVHTTDTQSQIAVAATTDGFVVTWRSSLQDGSNADVFARLVSSAGEAVAAEFQVNAYTTNNQYTPDVAGGADGDFVVVWTSATQDGSAAGIFGQRFSPGTLDIDGNGTVAALSDGVLVLRYMFGFTDLTLTNGVVAGNCTRCDAGAIAAYLGGLGPLLDIDDSGGAADPPTDGVLVLRYLFGFRGTTLTNGAVNDDDCGRCDASTIEPYLDGLI